MSIKETTNCKFLLFKIQGYSQEIDSLNQKITSLSFDILRKENERNGLWSFPWRNDRQNLKNDITQITEKLDGIKTQRTKEEGGRKKAMEKSKNCEFIINMPGIIEKITGKKMI